MDQKVSVITPYYNQYEFLAEYRKSPIAQIGLE